MSVSANQASELVKGLRVDTQDSKVPLGRLAMVFHGGRCVDGRSEDREGTADEALGILALVRHDLLLMLS